MCLDAMEARPPAGLGRHRRARPLAARRDPPAIRRGRVRYRPLQRLRLRRQQLRAGARRLMVGRVDVTGIGFVAPGLPDAEALRAHLAGAPLTVPEGWRPGAGQPAAARGATAQLQHRAGHRRGRTGRARPAARCRLGLRQRRRRGRDADEHPRRARAAGDHDPAAAVPERRAQRRAGPVVHPGGRRRARRRASPPMTRRRARDC